MKKLILCNNLYNDCDSLNSLITTMEFEDFSFGQYIKDFHYVPQGLQDFFSQVLSEPIEIQPDTGTFRKPNDQVHVEPFYQHCLWVGIVALEDTTLKIHKHESGKTVLDDLTDFDTSPDKWATEQTLNMSSNDFVFIRPWQWHSLEKGKLVQVFLLNHSIEEKIKDG